MRLFKLSCRAAWEGFCALIKIAQGYRVLTWLRDHYDDL